MRKGRQAKKMPQATSDQKTKKQKIVDNSAIQPVQNLKEEQQSTTIILLIAGGANNEDYWHTGTHTLDF